MRSSTENTRVAARRRPACRSIVRRIAVVSIVLLLTACDAPTELTYPDDVTVPDYGVLEYVETLRDGVPMYDAIRGGGGIIVLTETAIERIDPAVGR